MFNFFVLVQLFLLKIDNRSKKSLQSRSRDLKNGQTDRRSILYSIQVKVEVMKDSNKFYEAIEGEK